MITANKKINRKRRHARVRAKVAGTSERPRISVFRSNKITRVQLIDDEKGHTLVTVSSVEGGKKTPMEEAKIVGVNLAKEAKKNGIVKVVFDRGGYAYHGRVRMVAEGAREGGLEF